MKGPLGLPRFRQVAPLASRRPLFSQELDTNEEFVDAAEDIIEETGISPDVEEGDEDFERMKDELAERAFPDSPKKQGRLKDCIESSWADNWREGFNNATNQPSTPLEAMVKQASACVGMVESSTIGD